MADLRIKNHMFIEDLDELAHLIEEARSQSADTVPGPPHPGANDASEKAQAPTRPVDLAVDPRSADS